MKNRSNWKLKIGRGRVDVVVVVGGDDDDVDKNFANFRLEINIFDRLFGAKMSFSGAINFWQNDEEASN